MNIFVSQLSKGQRITNLFVPKLSKEQRQIKVFLPQLSKERTRSGIFAPQLSKEQRQSEVFVPQLSKERRRSEVFVPQLIKERRRSEVFVPQLSMICHCYSRPHQFCYKNRGFNSDVQQHWYCSFPALRDCAEPSQLPMDSVRISNVEILDLGLGEASTVRSRWRSLSSFRKARTRARHFWLSQQSFVYL
jgi:hypothetical protein